MPFLTFMENNTYNEDDSYIYDDNFEKEKFWVNEF